MTTPAIMARVVFDESDALKSAQTRYPSLGVQDINLACECRLVYLSGAKDQHAKDKALLEQVLALNGKLERALENYKHCRHGSGGCSCVIEAFNALAENAAAMKELGEVK
jgi:hypothetical protein